MTKIHTQLEEQSIEQAYADWLDRQMSQQDSWADTHLEVVGGDRA